MFIRTTAINKIRSMNKFVRAVKGGSSAGKTFGIIPDLIDYATKNKLKEISIVAESVPHLKRGAMKDFIKIMQETNRWNRPGWNASDFKYTFHNGAFIEFFSADNDSKLRGARRDVLYMNEANNMSFHAYTELAMRTKDFVYLDWNPVSEFWFDTELSRDDNVDFITLTYKDNEAVPPAAVDFIERAGKKAVFDLSRPIESIFNDDNIKNQYWANWYRVYGLGLVGSLEGVIFNNWSQIQKLPDGAQLLGYGMDFGYSNDPTALVGVYRYDQAIILDELIYKTGMLNSDIIREMNQLGVNQKALIFADSAEPKTIEEIRRSGFNIGPTVKGADSITFGISILQEQKILVTANSVNLIKEFRNYTWDKDKNGGKLNKPIDDWNHAIDAIRYFAMMKLKKTAQSFVLVGGRVVR